MSVTMRSAQQPDKSIRFLTLNYFYLKIKKKFNYILNLY